MKLGPGEWVFSKYSHDLSLYDFIPILNSYLLSRIEEREEMTTSSCQGQNYYRRLEEEGLVASDTNIYGSQK